MARADLLNILYSKDKSPLEFKFDSLYGPPILSFLTPEDVQSLYNIATSVKYNTKVELKNQEIKNIMNRRGFRKLASGTNRTVYVPYEDQSFVVKIALDRVGMGDNPAEFMNQNILKPFVTKCFDYTPCGTVGTFERVEPILSKEEFHSMGEDIYNLLTEFIIGKYVLEDIGTNYFMNWGIRRGFGPTLLDYPYVFELDGNKMYCQAPNKQDKTQICGGEIDYDFGFNKLLCTKCGAPYFAKLLQKMKEDKLIIIKGDVNMRVRVMSEGKVVKDFGSSSDFIKPVEEQKKSPLLKHSSVRVVDHNKTNMKEVFDNALKNIHTNATESFYKSAQPFEPKVTGIVTEPVQTQEIKDIQKTITVSPVEEPKVTIGNKLNNYEEKYKNQSVVTLSDNNINTSVELTNSETEKFLIENMFNESMREYNYSEDERADSEQRKRITTYLFNNLVSFINKNGIVLTEPTLKVVNDYIDLNYTFEEDIEQKDSNLLSTFGLSEEDFEDNKFEKIQKGKKIKITDF